MLATPTTTYYHQKTRDPEARQRIIVVGEQGEIEVKCIEMKQKNKNLDLSAKFVVESRLTPLYIPSSSVTQDKQGLTVLKEGQSIPEGLIPRKKMEDPKQLSTVLFRCQSLQDMLDAYIPITILCINLERPKADNLPGTVDDTVLKQTLEKYKDLIKVVQISKAEHDRFIQDAGGPAAMYFADGALKAAILARNK